MILHILNKGPSDNAIFSKMSMSIEKGDSILLIEDGVYHCLSRSIDSIHALSPVYILKSDALARGIVIPDSINSVGYDGFVKLTLEHKKTLSWY